MHAQKYVFAVEDTTSYNALRPVVDVLPSSVDVEFLLLDTLYESIYDQDVLSPAVRSEHDYRDVEEYVRIDRPLFTSFPGGVGRAAAQKLLIDTPAYRIPYDVSGYIADADPDVFLCAMDTLPFVRQAIEAMADRDVVTAVLQHGTYPKNLSQPWIERRFGVLSPKFSPPVEAVERLKRRLAYRYGVSVYCNPYVDVVLTLGEFFTERIQDLRESAPGSDRSRVVTTGSTEFDTPVEAFAPATDSLLFLSQQEWESGHWTDEQLETVVRMLNRYDERIDVTVRPHPKDSAEKTRRYGEQFDVSGEDSLHADVRDHDVVVATHSTAMFEGVLLGKATGVLRLPWDTEVAHQTFPPFVHDHVLQLGPDPIDFEAAVERRSARTQRDWLRRFCYAPQLFDDRDGGSAERVVETLEGIVASGAR